MQQTAETLITKVDASKGVFRLPVKAVRSVGAAVGQEGPWKRTYEKLSAAIEQGQIIILYGDRWTGKTVMAMALFCDAVRHGRLAAYIRQIELLHSLRMWFNNQEGGSYHNYASKNLHLLIIDESGVKVRGDGFSTTDAALLTTLIDERYSMELATVFISNESLEEISDSLGPTIMRRVAECGQAVECNWKGFNQ